MAKLLQQDSPESVVLVEAEWQAEALCVESKVADACFLADRLRAARTRAPTSPSPVRILLPDEVASCGEGDLQACAVAFAGTSTGTMPWRAELVEGLREAAKVDPGLCALAVAVDQEAPEMERIARVRACELPVAGRLYLMSEGYLNKHAWTVPDRIQGTAFAEWLSRRQVGGPAWKEAFGTPEAWSVWTDTTVAACREDLTSDLCANGAVLAEWAAELQQDPALQGRTWQRALCAAGHQPSCLKGSDATATSGSVDAIARAHLRTDDATLTAYSKPVDVVRPLLRAAQPLLGLPCRSPWLPCPSEPKSSLLDELRRCVAGDAASCVSRWEGKEGRWAPELMQLPFLLEASDAGWGPAHKALGEISAELSGGSTADVLAALREGFGAPEWANWDAVVSLCTWQDCRDEVIAQMWSACGIDDPVACKVAEEQRIDPQQLARRSDEIRREAWERCVAGDLQLCRRLAEGAWFGKQGDYWHHGDRAAARACAGGRGCVEAMAFAVYREHDVNGCTDARCRERAGKFRRRLVASWPTPVSLDQAMACQGGSGAACVGWGLAALDDAEETAVTAFETGCFGGDDDACAIGRGLGVGQEEPQLCEGAQCRVVCLETLDDDACYRAQELVHELRPDRLRASTWKDAACVLGDASSCK